MTERKEKKKNLRVPGPQNFEVEWWALFQFPFALLEVALEAVHCSGNSVNTVSVMDTAATGVVYSWNMFELELVEFSNS